MALSLQRLLRMKVSYSKLCTLMRKNSLCTCTEQKAQKRKEVRSSLFVSNSSEYAPLVKVDDDWDERISNPTELTYNLKSRGMESADSFVKKLVTEYKSFKTSLSEVEMIEKARKDTAIETSTWASKQGKLKKNKLPPDPEVEDKVSSLSKQGKSLKVKLQSAMSSHWDIEDNMMIELLKLPNYLHPDTPSTESKIVEEFGHANDGADGLEIGDSIDKYIKYSEFGRKAYYLTGKAALMEFSLSQDVSVYLRQNGYSQLTCPELFKTVPVEGAGLPVSDSSKTFWMKWSKDEKNSDGRLLYRLYMRGVSPVSFASYLSRMKIQDKDLPAKFFTVGRSYSPDDECDLPGLYGVPQTMKAEAAVVCRNIEESDMSYNKLKADILEYFKSIQIPMRVICVSARQLSSMEMKREEIHLWCPSLRKFVRIASVSLCGDYVSRRLMIRQTQKGVHHSKPVFMVHGQVANITSLTALKIEHKQEIGEALLDKKQPYRGK